MSSCENLRSDVRLTFVRSERLSSSCSAIAVVEQDRKSRTTTTRPDVASFLTALYQMTRFALCGPKNVFTRCVALREKLLLLPLTQSSPVRNESRRHRISRMFPYHTPTIAGG